MSIGHNNQEKGAVLVLLVFCVGLCVAFLAFSIDVARAIAEKRKVQIVADLSALSALPRLGRNATYESVLERILAVASVNGVTAGEVTQVVPRCGVWTSGVFLPAAAGVCDATSNSIEVTIQRALPLYLPTWFARNVLSLEGRSVSYQPPSVGNCVRPFGIEESAVEARSLVNGSTFTISGTQNSGNWGKIDLNGNSSSGTVYTDLMLNNLCDDAFRPGNWVSAGTGNAQISQVFQTILSDTSASPAWQNLVLALTSDFPRGNGLVQIRRFMRVDILSQRGGGQGWTATLRIVELDAQPDSAIPARRQLVE